jgi:hypothetical protein
MPSKDKKVIGTKVSEYEYQMIERCAEMQNMSVSALLGICARGLIDGDIEIEKGELKQGVNPNGYGLSDDFSGKIYEILTNKGYPDRAIDQMKETIISSVKESPKYDARRTRDDWC